MPFWLHQHPALRVIAMAPPSHSYGIAGAVGFIISTLLYLHVIQPLRHQEALLQKQFDVLAEQVAAFERVLDAESKLRTRNERLKEEKQQFAADIALLQDTINDLLMVMREHGVSCRAIKPLSSKAYDFHEDNMVALRAKGTFHQLLSLLQTLEQPQYPITIRAIHISKARGNTLTLDAIVHVISVRDG